MHKGSCRSEKMIPYLFISKRYKLVVAKGFAQEYWINYEETYNSTVKMNMIRISMANITLKKWFLHQLDMKKAYPYRENNNSIFSTLTGYRALLSHAVFILYLNKRPCIA